MTDRYYALTVFLDGEIRSDDAECIINAIKMIKHVQEVKPRVAESEIYFAQLQASNELKRKLFEVLEIKI